MNQNQLMHVLIIWLYPGEFHVTLIDGKTFLLLSLNTQGSSLKTITSYNVVVGR